MLSRARAQVFLSGQGNDTFLDACRALRSIGDSLSGPHRFGEKMASRPGSTVRTRSLSATRLTSSVVQTRLNFEPDPGTERVKPAIWSRLRPMSYSCRSERVWSSLRAHFTCQLWRILLKIPGIVLLPGEAVEGYPATAGQISDRPRSGAAPPIFHRPCHASYAWQGRTSRGRMRNSEISHAPTWDHDIMTEITCLTRSSGRCVDVLVSRHAGFLASHENIDRNHPGLVDDQGIDVELIDVLAKVNRQQREA